MHGRDMELPDDRDHFHIVGLKPTQPGRPADQTEPVQTRNGMYSRVQNTQDFEWDGWRNHD